jgi:rubredoxin
MSKDKYFCPACGYPELEAPPYKNMKGHPYPLVVVPPYENAWGPASYDVCSCCGYEFGFDDNPGGDSPGTPFTDYLKEWFNDGQKWFEPDKKPAQFDIVKQLEAAQIPVPDYIKVSRQLL